MINNLLKVDLDFILDQTGQTFWETLRDRKILITGGTGFVGSWLMESLLWANDYFNLNTRISVLTRFPNYYIKNSPHLALHKDVTLLEGDVRYFYYNKGPFTDIIHAAADSNNNLLAGDPIKVFDTILLGTLQVLNLAVKLKSSNLLFVSSGAIYGRQPLNLDHIPESFNGIIDPSNQNSVYGEGKRTAETLCSLFYKQHQLNVKIARCFAFVGPYLPLSSHFAIGNFIRDCLDNHSIKINGDGSPLRSYLYASELAIWLWTVLINGRPNQAYNIGSEIVYSIKQIAENVAKHFDPIPAITIAKSPNLSVLSERYIPSTQKAQVELNLFQKINLDLAIEKTVQWARKR